MKLALTIDEKSYGPEHPDVARNLNNLAALLQATNRLGEAEPLMTRALAIDEKSYGAEHPTVAIRLNNLASLLRATNRPAEAEPLLKRAFVILLKFTRETGHFHPRLRSVFANWWVLLDEISLADEEISERFEHAVIDAGFDLESFRKLLGVKKLRRGRS